MSWNFQAPSSKLQAWKFIEGIKEKLFCVWPPTFDVKSWRSSVKKITLAFLETPKLGIWKVQERFKQIFLPWPSSYAN